MKRRRIRRRNEARAPMKIATKVALALGVGGLVGVMTYVVFGSTKQGGQTLDDALDVIDDTGIRIPQPAMKMVLPETEEEFSTLDEVICEIGEPLVTNAPPGTTADEVIAKIHEGLARELYPDFPWPPMSGDNPTVSQLWTELGLLARRAVVTGTICPEEGAA